MDIKGAAPHPYPYPLPISRALRAAEEACATSGAGEGEDACHEAVLRLADALIRYLGAVAVAQYSQALYTGEIAADPTLNRSLRSLRRLLPSQWLGWTARGLGATPGGPVVGMGEWYTQKVGGEIAEAYGELRRVMVERLGYTGEYGPQEMASPRVLLEMVDQYRIRGGKAEPGIVVEGEKARLSQALLAGLRASLAGATFLSEYTLYAPQERKLLTGLKVTAPMPPLTAPPEAEATLLLYSPGELPDYTKRPNLHAERKPLFPLDPLLTYIHCPQCDRPQVAALAEVVGDAPLYTGLDPDCGHQIRTIRET